MMVFRLHSLPCMFQVRVCFLCCIYFDAISDIQVSSSETVKFLVSACQVLILGTMEVFLLS